MRTALVTDPDGWLPQVGDIEYRTRGKCDNPKWNNWLRGEYIPCRRCSKCLQRRRWHWVHRILIEANKWPCIKFLTLTFRRIPDDPYKEIQKFIKRVRKSIGCQLKYVVTEEAGKLRGRIHFHALVFFERQVPRRAIESP